MTLFARITGTGSFLPPRKISNQDLVTQLTARGLDSSDEWIVERTGIKHRHFVDDGVHASDLAFEAARRCLTAASRKAADVDLIIVATSTPDMVFPSTASILQHKLTLAALADGDTQGGAGGAAFDVQAVCSGFVYAISVANAMIQT
ncbi:MAG: 3-oxoacyl-ACP synthase, partial [Burkholderiaceae bacterium]|nr:3-oxoacyl-ACP synthase [Burkholderiaceae bacterium]